MSLEALYNNAGTNTYVGTVRTRQAADAAINGAPLVNFLDGTRRTGPAADEFQTEFTRTAPGTGVTGGVPKNTSGIMTRWTSKAFKLAFDGEGPASLINGYYNNAFRPSFNGKQVHTYSPLLNKSFGAMNESARNRIAAAPTSTL
jgi:hypothetical protein